MHLFFVFVIETLSLWAELLSYLVVLHHTISLLHIRHIAPAGQGAPCRNNSTFLETKLYLGNKSEVTYQVTITITSVQFSLPFVFCKLPRATQLAGVFVFGATPLSIWQVFLAVYIIWKEGIGLAFNADKAVTCERENESSCKQSFQA